MFLLIEEPVMKKLFILGLVVLLSVSMTAPVLAGAAADDLSICPTNGADPG